MIDKLMKEYLNMFGDSFPMYQLARGKSDKEVAKMIEKCLKAGKDAYSMGLCSLDEDYLC